MKNIIYVFTNPCFPDLVKIGITDDLKHTLSSLYNSSIPTPFECYFACTVSDMDLVKKQIHDGFDDFRVNPKRDFFRINPDRVVSILNLIMIDDVTLKEEFVEDEIDKKSLNSEKKTKEVNNSKNQSYPQVSEEEKLEMRKFLKNFAKELKVHKEEGAPLTRQMEKVLKNYGPKKP